MIHFSCDRCKCTLDADNMRYVLRVEVQAAFDPCTECAEEEDRDHLLEIQEILERLDANESDDVGEDIYHRQRYDLCADCYRVFLENPLGVPSQVHNLPFSTN